MTLLEALNKLPEPVKTKALHNYKGFDDSKECESIELALRYAFSWERTPQGYDYWKGVSQCFQAD